MQGVHEALLSRLLLSTPESCTSPQESRIRASTVSGPTSISSPERVPSPRRRLRAHSEVGVPSPSPGSIGPSALSGSATIISPLRRDHFGGGKSFEDRFGYESGGAGGGYSKGYPVATTPQSLATQSPSPAAEPHHSFA
ncbi:hypothetical protein HK097_006244, partial [Rhizophlyctis rosea]